MHTVSVKEVALCDFLAKTLFTTARRSTPELHHEQMGESVLISVLPVLLVLLLASVASDASLRRGGGLFRRTGKATTTTSSSRWSAFAKSDSFVSATFLLFNFIPFTHLNEQDQRSTTQSKKSSAPSERLCDCRITDDDGDAMPSITVVVARRLWHNCSYYYLFISNYRVMIIAP